MSATSFTIDRRDIDFVLHEQLELTSRLKPYPRFQDFDRSRAGSELAAPRT